MAIFENAKWIWTGETGIDNYGEFSVKFTSFGDAILNISCDGDYTAFINGKYVSSGQYGDYEHYKIYDSIDITPYIRNGENTLSILAWHFGQDSSRYKRANAGVIFEIVEKDKVIFSSDKSVLSRKSKAYTSGLCKQITSQLGFSYLYDSTKEDAWLNGDLIDFTFSQEAEKGCVFFPRPIKKHILGEIINAKYILSDNTYLFDLGKEIVGLLSFSLNASEKASINIAYGEHLENGHVKRKIHERDFSVDYVAEKGENTYTNYMLRIACRYIEVSSDRPITINQIGIIPQLYPTERAGKSLPTALDNQIYDICVNTLELCMMEHYVDCPWREQCFYAFDSRNQMLCGYYAFKGGNYDYARANLVLISKDKREDGLLSICYPCGIDLTIPSFSLYYLISVLEYIKHSGDKTIINEVNPKLKEILSTLEKNANGNLVKRFLGENHWNFYDWSPNLDGSLGNSEKAKPDATINLLTIIALKSYKEICQICELEFEYDKFLDCLINKAREAFFDSEKLLFVDTKETGNYLELTNALGILSGIVPDASENIAKSLENGELFSSSLSMKCFVYDALIQLDKAKYKDFILNDIRVAYKKMLDFGSTTVWETIDGRDAFDGAGSLCHGWSAIPIYYYSIL